MFLVMKLLARTLKVLNSEESPRQVAAGFAWGAVIGLLPFGMLPVALFVAAFLVNVNLALLFVSAAVFKIVAFGVDPLAERLGFLLLVETGAFQGLWTAFYNAPLLPFTRFNNTLVMGSLAVGLLACVPLYVVGLRGVALYRARWREAILKTRVMLILKSSKIYKLYATAKGWTG